jgi:uncharacterized protein YcbX
VRSVALISVSPVKAFALEHPDEVRLTPRGVVENRRFFLVDGEGNRLRSSLTPWPVRVRARYDAGAERVSMRFPDGQQVEGNATGNGELVRCGVSNRKVEARIVDGPWTEPLSALAGHPVRLARPSAPGDVFAYPVSLVSQASVERLAREAAVEVDGRRFRMLFTLTGCEPHEEDAWEGRLVRFGEVLVRVGGPIERCAVTTRDPDTGRRDLDTLSLIKRYRGMPRGTIDFGVYGNVERPGRVRVGDPVEPR